MLESTLVRFAGLVATVVGVLVAPALAEAQTTTTTTAPTTATTPTSPTIPGGRVTGQTWHDIDGDRVVDAGEAAVVGVEVLIIDLSGRLADRPLTVRTDATGRFDAVVAGGSYQACFGAGASDLRLQAIANPAAPGAWTVAVNRNCSEAFPIRSGSVVQVDAAYATDVPADVTPPGRPPSDPRGVLALTGVEAGSRVVLAGLLALVGVALGRVASRLTARTAP